MASGLPSDEVAEDFKEALQDLKINSKPEIDVLTVIAKENTEHAQAISRVLENHIKSTRPEWKLPSLYVLDSLIRHVGPPYSTYLGRNLFRTFMDAYTLVEGSTRKEMEILLKSWKQPTPLSRDPRPVLPGEITREIENALIKYRTVAFQAQQQARNYPSQIPSRGAQFRDSPTPVHNPTMVGMNSNANTGDIAQLMGSLQQRSSTPTYPQTSGLQGPPVVRSPMPQTATPVPRQAYNGTPTNFGPSFQPPSAVSQQQLQNDVRQILLSANFQKTLDPSDSRTQQLISTLENLKAILDSQQFDSTQLQIMQTELSKISSQIQSRIATLIGSNPPTIVTPTPAPPSTVPRFPTYSTPPPTMSLPPAYVTQPPSTNITPLPPNLASLLGSLPPPPQPQTSNGTSSQSGGDNPLLAQLRAAGLLPSTPTPEPVAVHRTSGSRRYGVELDQDSITKIRRPHLIESLYQAKPDQCRQCGRRFPNTEEGKKAKVKHLDWHFRVNSRVADNTRNAIVHRSPYLNELQWAKLREHQDGSDDSIEGASANSGAAAAKENEEQFVPAPTDVAKLNEPCSICMEQFKSVWHAKTQQPVWMDAIRVGDKYYHASCYSEVNRGNTGPAANVQTSWMGGGGVATRNGYGGGAGDSARNTPDAILGKRKFEGMQ